MFVGPHGSQAATGAQTTHMPNRATLGLPARPEMWAIVRTTARAIALQIALPFDDLEDLRVAIAELCASCAYGAESDALCECSFEWTEDSFSLSCTVSPVALDVALLDRSPMRPAQLELSRQILDAVVDDYEIFRDKDGMCRGSLRKNRSLSHFQ